MLFADCFCLPGLGGLWFVLGAWVLRLRAVFFASVWWFMMWCCLPLCACFGIAGNLTILLLLLLYGLLFVLLDCARFCWCISVG